MSKIIFVSNRLPRKIRKKKGELSYQDSAGGLATGLYSLSEGSDIKWIGWPGLPTESMNRKQREEVKENFERDHLIPVFLTRREITDFYRGFCNRTIWPLFHYFTQHAEYHRDQWEKYVSINRKFLDEVMEVYEEGDLIWVHDYHLMLLPSMIRDRVENASIGFFLHIPFPSYEVYRLFPWRKEILEGLLGSDLIGFHTYDYVTHFLQSVRRIIGFEHELGIVNCGKHLCKVDAYPMGIDYEKFSEGSKTAKVSEYIQEIKGKVGDRKIVLSIDRLDYSKGILNRLEAFDRFLSKYSSWIENVTLILVAVPSREKVDHYEMLKKSLDEKVGYINGRYGQIGWTPVWYIYRFLPFEKLLALYKTADVCMITPLRDGMNLMAKEYLATKEDGRGVLILSEMAGAAHELGESLIVNPNDFDEVADSISRALNLDEKEQIERNTTMQKRLRRYDIRKWGLDFFSDLKRSRSEKHPILSKRLISGERRKLLKDFIEKPRKLIVLDYDGTLAEFSDKPQDAGPDAEVLEILKDLSSHGNNEVFIISGRDRSTLDEWFMDTDVKLCAEHGALIKVNGKDWKPTVPMETDWMVPIRNLLEVYTERTPGSFVEEKEYSLVWHFRKTNPEMGSIRSRELMGDLLDLTSNTDLSIMEGNKVIEIKKAGVNKGTIVTRLMEENDWDLVLALGDDITDEEMFKVMPEKGYSIKVGLQPTNARYNLESVTEVRSLLKELMENR